MKTYTITIEETVSDSFEVVAEDEGIALEIAKDKYKFGEFVLEPGNLQSKRIAVSNLNKEISEWIEF